jgi:hypothetical protein
MNLSRKSKINSKETILFSSYKKITHLFRHKFSNLKKNIIFFVQENNAPISTQVVKFANMGLPHN